MNYCIYFSPTGSTEKIVKRMGEAMGSTADIDISKADFQGCEVCQEDFAVFGVPSFGGRVPDIAAERLCKIKGNATKAVIVVTYGGRAYEDTMVELKSIIEKQGFVCIGAAAIVTQHSIAGEINTGRPFEKDYDEISAFMEDVKERLTKKAVSVEVPGSIPYKEYKVLPMEVFAEEACDKCGKCAAVCPVGAIPEKTPNHTDAEKCISCMRCIRTCHLNARKTNRDKMNMLSEKLKTICQPDKKNEFY